MKRPPWPKIRRIIAANTTRYSGVNRNPHIDTKNPKEISHNIKDKRCNESLSLDAKLFISVMSGCRAGEGRRNEKLVV